MTLRAALATGGWPEALTGHKRLRAAGYQSRQDTFQGAYDLRVELRAGTIP